MTFRAACSLARAAGGESSRSTRGLTSRRPFRPPATPSRPFRRLYRRFADAGLEIVIGYAHENPTVMTREQETEALDKCIAWINKLFGGVPMGYVAAGPM